MAAMDRADSKNHPSPARFDRFATTHWSVVLAAGRDRAADARAALGELCQTYWYPLYAFVRRQVGNVHDAQDLTQAFFARLLEQDLVAVADPQRGKFRAFLLTACRRFLLNEGKKRRALKRGGGRLQIDLDAGESRYSLEPVDHATPEKLYDRQWAVTLLAKVLDRLRAELAAAGKADHFELFQPLLGAIAAKHAAAGEAVGKAGAAGGAYAEIAARLDLTADAAKTAAHRLRRRYKELLRAEIGRTVSGPGEVEDEIRSLFEALG